MVVQRVPRTAAVVILIQFVCIGSWSRAEETIDFDRDVLPLLVNRCLDCHNSADRKGELDLSVQENALRGIAPVIMAGDASASELWQQVAEEAMPPEHPLTEQEKSVFKKWIDQGAKWGRSATIDRFAYTTEQRAGTDWWSLQAVKRPAPPEVQHANWVRNPIDAFVAQKLEAHSLSPAPQADRTTLIRRATFDLIGLPPTPEEIDNFVRDNRPDAYARLIDRLLDSTHYGERWARHWLDIARYTESQGFEYDRFRPNAWPYRDYIINSFNADKPYNVFVQEQIAGDVQNFANPQAGVASDGIVATSLLVCGPWDQAGNSQANVTQKMITREEELEDLVSVVGQSILGMTINCARCHSHKFDPIPQEDYYRFKAVFEGVRHGERAIESEDEKAARIRKVDELRSKVKDAEREIAELEQRARARVLATQAPVAAASEKQVAAPTPLARWSFSTDAKDELGTMHGELVGGATVRDGRLVLNGKNQFLRTAPSSVDIREKTLEAWLLLPTLDQAGGGVISLQTLNGSEFDAIVFGERQPQKWIAGSNNFQRTQDLKATPETQVNALIHVAIVYASDQTITVYRNGVPYAASYASGSLLTYRAEQSQVLLGQRHTGAGNGALTAEIESASLYSRALTAEEIASSFAAGADGQPVVPRERMLAAMNVTERTAHKSASEQLQSLRESLQHLPQSRVAYVGVRKQPAPTAVLVRGDITKPGEIVRPGGLAAIQLNENAVAMEPDAPEAERRVELARWITDPRHPLTARVLVNRLWHYHFGRGIVETPNDFGFNGARPTHPELLDWLAAEFVESRQPWSIKHMHRVIMNSATYQQASTFSEAAATIDADNALLWRFAPHRLEGEIIRDAMLAVSGQMNRSVGGPSFMPFIITNFNSDFYQPTDPVGAEFNRRSIYRANINSGKSAMMDALDCPDPSIKTPARRVTTTPLAALALMNNSFVQRQAQHLAERVAQQSNNDLHQSVQLAYRLCFGRPATPEEVDLAAALAADAGLDAVCWALLNATEFMYVN